MDFGWFTEGLRFILLKWGRECVLCFSSFCFCLEASHQLQLLLLLQVSMKEKKKKSPICFFIFYGFFSSLHFKLKPLIFLQKILIFSGFFSPPLHFQLKPLIFLAELVTGFFSNALSALMKWLWSLTTTSKTGRDLKIFSGTSQFSP